MFSPCVSVRKWCFRNIFYPKNFKFVLFNKYTRQPLLRSREVKCLPFFCYTLWQIRGLQFRCPTSVYARLQTCVKYNEITGKAPLPTPHKESRRAAIGNQKRRESLFLLTHYKPFSQEMFNNPAAEQKFFIYENENKHKKD